MISAAFMKSVELIFFLNVPDKERTMKLLTHNMLTSKCIKTVTTGYPLVIEARDVKVSEVEFNADFVARILPKVYYYRVSQKKVGTLGKPKL